MGHSFGFMWVFSLIFLAIFVFFMRVTFAQNNSTKSESPREILDKRFVPGEINKDEYEEMKNTLNK